MVLRALNSCFLRLIVVHLVFCGGFAVVADVWGVRILNNSAHGVLVLDIGASVVAARCVAVSVCEGTISANYTSDI